MFVLSQCSSIIEFWLRRRLRTCRNEAYVHTVKSRGKGSDWWTLYYEEWEEPPYEKAKKNTKKQPLYLRLGAPLIRKVVLRCKSIAIDCLLFGKVEVSWCWHYQFDSLACIQSCYFLWISFLVSSSLFAFNSSRLKSFSNPSLPSLILSQSFLYSFPPIFDLFP